MGRIAWPGGAQLLHANAGAEGLDIVPCTPQCAAAPVFIGSLALPGTVDRALGEIFSKSFVVTTGYILCLPCPATASSCGINCKC